jgi:transcription initiation factor TFIID subunit 9B
MDKKNKTSKPSVALEIKHNVIPDEHRVMKTLLEELGVSDYDPQVVTQMLDFSYSYLTDILSDSQSFSKHAGRSAIDIEDVKLATKYKHERSKRGSAILPDRSKVAKFAKNRNEKKLDQAKSENNKLPAPRFCYNKENFKMVDLDPVNLGGTGVTDAGGMYMANSNMGNSDLMNNGMETGNTNNLTNNGDQIMGNSNMVDMGNMNQPELNNYSAPMQNN